MTTRLDVRYILLVALLLCSFFTVSTARASEENQAKQVISDLQRKVFRITTLNRKLNIDLITGYSGEPWEQEWWREGYAKPCINNIARLNRTEAATVIKGTANILALLDCPAANDGGAASIVSLFEGTNTEVPMCFSYIRLMDKPGYYYWGVVNSIEVRKLPDNTFIIVPTLSGGDAGDSWVSYAFLHMDIKCGLTLLSKFYASMHHDTDDPGKCEGESHTYKFINDSTIEIQRDRILCTKTTKRIERTITKRLDLDALLRRPKLRVFEP